MIDATYDYGFGRLAGMLPPDTVGGFPDDYYSTGYNAAMGTRRAGQPPPPRPGDPELPVHDRQQPERALLVVGELERPGADALGRDGTPAAGQGILAHAWGMAGAN